MYLGVPTLFYAWRQRCTCARLPEGPVGSFGGVLFIDTTDLCKYEGLRSYKNSLDVIDRAGRM